MTYRVPESWGLTLHIIFKLLRNIYLSASYKYHCRNHIQILSILGMFHFWYNAYSRTVVQFHVLQLIFSWSGCFFVLEGHPKGQKGKHILYTCACNYYDFFTPVIQIEYNQNLHIILQILFIGFMLCHVFSLCYNA